VLKHIATLQGENRIAALNELIPYAQTIGLEIVYDEHGLVTVLRRRESNMGNTQLPAIHGGAVGALLEHAAMLHLISETQSLVVPKIINFSVDYLRPCLMNDTYARGLVIRQGRRVANVRVEAWQVSPDRPVAAAHAHFLHSITYDQ